MKVLVTGGPTRAWLDRVRFLTNISSGEMALEVCRALRKKRVDVALVSGPCDQPFEKLGLAKWERVETAEEMHEAVMRLCRTFKPDAAVFTAAVLDFAPAKRLAGKVTSRGGWTVKLKPTPKIIDDVGRRFPRVRRIGFKLEWKRRSDATVRRLATTTVARKGLDALCLNFLSELGPGRHPAELWLPDGTRHRARTKREVAAWIAAVCANPV